MKDKTLVGSSYLLLLREKGRPCRRLSSARRYQAVLACFRPWSSVFFVGSQVFLSLFCVQIRATSLRDTPPIYSRSCCLGGQRSE